MPILNSGILKGVSTPLSVVIALRSEVNASSLSPVLDIDEGRERSRYVVFSGAMMKGREVRRRGVKRVGLFVQQAGFDNVDVALHVARQITWKVQGPGALSVRNNHVTGLEISTRADFNATLFTGNVICITTLGHSCRVCYLYLNQTKDRESDHLYCYHGVRAVWLSFHYEAGTAPIFSTAFASSPAEGADVVAGAVSASLAGFV